MRRSGMDREAAQSVLDELHAAQNAMYAGGDVEAMRQLLAPDVEWHVPGDNEIAGTYRGIDEVLEYFRRRRALAAGTLQLHPGALLVGDEFIASMTDGSAVLDGVEHRWSTVGLYRLGGRRIAACWLLPLDAELFDRIWSPQPGSPRKPGSSEV